MYLISEEDPPKRAQNPDAELEQIQSAPAELSSRVRSLIEEIRGSSSESHYYPYFEDGLTKEQDRSAIAEAMELSGERFELMDRIALNLTRSALRDQPFVAHYRLLSRGEWLTMDLDQIFEQRLNRYRLPVDHADYWGVSPTYFDIVSRTSRGPVRLRLAFHLRSQRLRWSARGSSLIKSSDLKLVERLNGVLDDYAERLELFRAHRKKQWSQDLSRWIEGKGAAQELFRRAEAAGSVSVDGDSESNFGWWGCQLCNVSYDAHESATHGFR